MSRILFVGTGLLIFEELLKEQGHTVERAEIREGLSGITPTRLFVDDVMTEQPHYDRISHDRTYGKKYRRSLRK